MTRKVKAGGVVPPAKPRAAIESETLAVMVRTGALAQLLRGKPLTARYRDYVRELERVNQAEAEGQDKLACVLSCVLATMHFLDSDPAVAATTDTRLLGTLAAALRDTLIGGKPPLLHNRERSPGAPPSQSFANVQGICAAGLTLLIEAGESREGAARGMAELLRRYRVLDRRSKAIDFRQTLRWRDEVDARAPALATAIYHDTLARWRSHVAPRFFDDRARCWDAIEGAIAAVVSQGF